MHSPKYNKVKTYYDTGAWSIERVRLAVTKNWITAEEFEDITGEPYEEYIYSSSSLFSGV